MKSFEKYVEQRNSEIEGGTQPSSMRINRPRKINYDDSFEIISQLKKPQVQMAVGKVLQSDPETAEMLKDILNRALRYSALDHYNSPKFPGWSGGWSDSEAAAANFVGKGADQS